MEETVKKPKWAIGLAGLFVGFLNGLFGAGGGMIAVPALRWLGLEEAKAHATSISITLPLAVASGLLYLRASHFALSDAWIYLPGGVVGAIVGALLLQKLKIKWLQRIFSLVVIFSAGRLLLK